MCPRQAGGSQRARLRPSSGSSTWTFKRLLVPREPSWPLPSSPAGWGQVLEEGQRCRMTAFAGPPPWVTEDRRARTLPRRPRPGIGPSATQWGRGPTYPWEGHHRPSTPGRQRQPPCVRQGENLFLLHSLGQNGRHLALAREARSALEQINKSKSANGRPACPELLGEGWGGQEEEGDRLQTEGGSSSGNPAWLPAEGSLLLVTSPLKPNPTHVWLQ